jgi:hypothetical protein
LVYVLSYAPLYRLMLGGDPTLILSIRVPRPAWWETAYVPVVFITENTPLGTPLLWWADIWNVQRSMTMDRDFRMHGLP